MNDVLSFFCFLSNHINRTQFVVFETASFLNIRKLRKKSSKETGKLASKDPVALGWVLRGDGFFYPSLVEEEGVRWTCWSMLRDYKGFMVYHYVTLFVSLRHTMVHHVSSCYMMSQKAITYIISMIILRGAVSVHWFPTSWNYFWNAFHQGFWWVPDTCADILILTVPLIQFTMFMVSKNQSPPWRFSM